MKKPSRRCAWFSGLILASLFFLAIASVYEIRFFVNDDKTILRAFLHYQPGGPNLFHAYIHTLLAHILWVLGTFFPNVAWYSLLLLFAQWFSCVVLVKSIVQCFLARGRSLAGALLLSCLCLWAFGLVYTAQLTYTATAAFLGAASCAQLMTLSLDEIRPYGVKGAGLAIGLFALAYSLRQMTAAALLPFFLLAFFAFSLREWLQGKGSHTSAHALMYAMTRVVALFLGVMLVLVGMRALEIQILQKRDYLDWLQARVRVMDYVDLDQVDPELFESLGWSDGEVQLIRRWYMADENITTEAFRAIAESQKSSPSLSSARGRLIRFAQTSRSGVRTLVVLGCLFVSCFLCLLIKRRNLGGPLLILCLDGLLLVAMVLYLALSGRILMRAVLLAAFPAAAIAACLLPQCLPDVSVHPVRRWSAALLTACLLLFSTCRFTTAALTELNVPYEKNFPRQMDQLAYSRPDLLFFFEISCGNDLRLFPESLNAQPVNLVSLGTYERGSEAYVRQLAAFGLESEHLNPSDFLHPQVRILSGDPQSTLFLQYLRDALGDHVQAVCEQVYGPLYVFRYEMQEDVL